MCSFKFDQTRLEPIELCICRFHGVIPYVAVQLYADTSGVFDTRWLQLGEALPKMDNFHGFKGLLSRCPDAVPLNRALAHLFYEEYQDDWAVIYADQGSFIFILLLVGNTGVTQNK